MEWQSPTLNPQQCSCIRQKSGYALLHSSGLIQQWLGVSLRLNFINVQSAGIHGPEHIN